MKDEALKLALEALKSATPKYTRQRKDQKTLGGALDYWKLEQHHRLRALAAIKQALNDATHLAAPVQEPVAWLELLREARDNCKASIAEDGISAMRKEYRVDLERRLTAALTTPQPQQQPEYKMNDEKLLRLALEAIERGVRDGYWNKDTVDVSTAIQKRLLKSTPPASQRQWVGLSDLNIDELENEYMKSAQTAHQFLRAIEAKLREKNT